MSKTQSMSMNLNVNIFSGMRLSTGHMPSEHPNFKGLQFQVHNGGYFVWVPSSYDTSCDDAPEWILPILYFASLHGLTLIDFDVDGNIVNGFMRFDW